MKKIFFFLFCVVFILACSNKKKIPQDILPQEKMQSVLWDVLSAGEFLEGFVFKDTTADRTRIALQWYDSIYKLHHITKADFERSYTYYREHPELMKEVLDSLSKKTLPANPDTTGTKPDSAKVAAPDSVRLEQLPSKKDTLTAKHGLPGIRGKQLFIDSVKRKRRSPRASSL